MLSFEVSFFDGVTEQESVQGGEEKGLVERVLVAVPERGGGAAGVAERVHVEIAKLFGIANQIRKGGGGLRVIHIMPLPESCHNEMVLDDKGDEFAAFGVDLEALEERAGEAHAAFAVILDGHGLADVVQEQDEIEQGGLGRLMQRLAVLEGDRLGFGEDAVELADGVEGVDVGRVTVIKLVLHEAGEPVERRDEPPQHAELVHELQRRKDRTGLPQDGAEAEVGVGGLQHAPGEQRQRLADEGGEVEIRRGVELLAVAEDADEAHGVLREDRGGAGGQLAAAQHEAVDLLDTLGAAHAQHLTKRQQGAAGFLDGQRQAVLDDHGDAINGLRLAVIILHEVLDALEDIVLAVAQALGDARLHLEVEEVGGAIADEVKLVADAQEEIVGALEVGKLLAAKVIERVQLLHALDAQLHAGHPEGVLIVAQAADAVLDVGFLQEGGVAVFRAARGLVVEAVGDVALGILRGGEVAVGLGKSLVERGLAGDEVRFEQGGFRLDVLARLHEDLVDGPRGMADLQVAVPEEVEDLVDQMFLQRLHDRRLRLRGEEEHHVDVALRAELMPAVAAERDQADRGGQFAMGAAVRIEGVVE